MAAPQNIKNNALTTYRMVCLPLQKDFAPTTLQITTRFPEVKKRFSAWKQSGAELLFWRTRQYQRMVAKCADARLVPAGVGRFRLAVTNAALGDSERHTISIVGLPATNDHGRRRNIVDRWVA
jgi:hypothetical protein